ncbi:RecA RecA/RadA recombinase [uncultured Caudovirales phage]|jgi:recombination protein RecA|uniref:RecA RecA/RadA recombinase n=1 Tax=uncultured Caudovirales phage TaxID=2100421 RepID=A0A6J5M8H4_9CAUD|nr:RecA RecA/RadA recombinase [uncultured Caudovirales phage]CAB4162524.1 RecA RecA/RadA recombinase [uncultured Caudovirales phage]
MTEGISKQLELAIAQIDRQYGAGSVMKLGSSDFEPWPSVPTGALSLDRILGIGGLPRGRIVEIYGPESSGKSTLALSIVAQAQKLGITCAYVDAEHALDPVYMQAVGVDVDELVFTQPDYGEQALEIVDKLVATGELGVVVIDSVASLIPKAELEGDMESAQMGLQARMMAKAMRKLVGQANTHKTLLVFINQLRNKIGVMFGNPETTPGGMALKYAASVRIDIRKREDIKDKAGNSVGIVSKVKIIKNKMAPPMKVTEFSILYGKGIDEHGCVLDVALDAGILTQKGAWIYYNGELFAQGRENAINQLRENEEVFLDMKEKIKSISS